MLSVRSFGNNPVPSHTIPDAYEYGYKLCPLPKRK